MARSAVAVLAVLAVIAGAQALTLQEILTNSNFTPYVNEVSFRDAAGLDRPAGRRGPGRWSTLITRARSPSSAPRPAADLLQLHGRPDLPEQRRE